MLILSDYYIVNKVILGKPVREIKALILPRYSSVKRNVIQDNEICQVLNPATDIEGEKGENIGNEYLPAYIMFRKAGIVLRPDRTPSFVRLYNGDKRDTDIS